ncbi:ArsR/SmtB family transcription factor [Streptomyces sp. NPDC087294]|uniref:ArsR/SmtB family transcription factor n=1 Tax=Streptomyces sp. NPDC087294 TaxID=3365777 RepID=UPI0038045E10
MTGSVQTDGDPGTDRVFKALADETRRRLLDRLHEENGQTLSELCGRVAMTRQSVTQHLAVLEAARLVSTVRRGREKLHYLNPVPLHEIQERWIDKFERPRLSALGAVRRRAEEAMSDTPSFLYVTYIRATPDQVWDALTDADLTASYWGHANVSDWRPGSRWDHVRNDGSGIADVIGTVVESERPTRLVVTWAAPEDEGRPELSSRVTFDVRRHEDIVRLTVTHEDLNGEEELNGVSGGWPAVLSNLKTLLETGSPLPQEPWLVPDA